MWVSRAAVGCRGPRVAAAGSLCSCGNPFRSSSSTSSDQSHSEEPQGEHENLSGASMEVLSTMYRSHPSQRFIITRRDQDKRRDEGEEEDEEEGGEYEAKPRGGRADHQTAAWRRYLTHPGVPEGTVFERELLASRMRLDTAQQRVHQHKLQSMGVVDDTVKVGEQERSLRPQKGIGAVVEDKIQLSMLQGDFDDLQGRGKPLERERTPGLDRTTDLFMDVLKRNGIKPEWIERQNRIAEMTDLMHQRIRAEFALALLDASPDFQRHAPTSRHPDVAVPHLCPQRFRDRVHGLASLQDDLSFLNREVDTYNLQVPSLHLQRLRIKLDQLIAQATWAGSTPKTLQEAHQVYRMAAREGLLGVTCLITFRAHQFDDHLGGHDQSHARPHGASFTPYWLDGEARPHSSSSGRRRRSQQPESNHLMQVVMIPIDAMARYLAKAFSI